jgi:integrase
VRHQNGYIFRKKVRGKCVGPWYGRWWEDKLENGARVRKQTCRKLADYGDRYHSKADVRSLLDRILQPMNEGRTDVRSTMLLSEFLNVVYLKAAESELKPSTYRGYEYIYRHYVNPQLNGHVLRDFRPVEGSKLLAEVHRLTGVRRKQLRHVKAFLCAGFSWAIQQGILDASNPMRDAKIPRNAEASKETIAVSLEQVLAMLDKLKGQAKTAVTAGFFLDLRPGELRGLCWPDYDRDGQIMHIRRSVWGLHTTTPKTEASIDDLPVIEPLRSILESQWHADGCPASGPILRGSKRALPLNLNNLARRVVIPTLKAANIEWHGWYSLRRGMATELDRVTGRPVASQQALRHKSMATTLKHYIKPDKAALVSGLKQIEVLCNHCATETVQ